LAEPMRRALEGQSGTVIGLDHRGALVLAAHEPVDVLDLGIVAKIDMAEIRAPFIRAGAVSGLATLVVILLGIVLLHRVSSPLVERLQTTVSSLANAQRIVHLGNWDWNIVDDELRRSDEIYRIFGLKPQEFGASCEAFLQSVHPDDRAMVNEAVEKALYEKAPYSITHRIVLPDGEERVVHEQAEVVFNASGTPVRMSGTVQDVTEQKRVQATLQKLSRVVEQSPTMIMITDTNGRIEYVNPKFTEMSGYTPEEAVGRTPAMLASGTTPEGMYKNLWTTLRAGDEWRGDIMNRKKNGDCYWCRENISLIRNSDGEDTHFLAIVEDISESKGKEQELRQAKEQAELASRTKSEFVANMSHELRSPLNAIIGFSEIIKEELFGSLGNPKYREYVKDIRESGTHLLDVINDILDLSKVESGKLEICEEAVDIRSVIDTCRRLIRARADKAGLRLETDIQPDLPELYVDPLKIKQVLLNLLANAVKFTPEGGAVTTTARMNESGRFVLTVADTGIGIAPQDIDKAMSAFGQVDSSLARKYPGTGLGLPLSKALVELHGGTLALKSEVDVGTTVVVTLPAFRVVTSELPMAVNISR
jgi:PAS domain S-box-containing protein